MDIDELLPYVQRPARYIGQEWNSCSDLATETKDVSICFCFPDLYELGMSSLGIEILYKIVNGTKNFSAERCFMPDSDLAKLLIEKNEKLCSLETKKPLNEFTLVGFSIQCELAITNVLAMLELGGIKLLSKERIAKPLLIAGGPAVSNPEPIAEFFDAMVIGDGEEAVVEIMSTVSKKSNKNEILLELSKLEGVYVPSLYEAEYKNGFFTGLRKKNAAAPESINKRIYDIRKKDRANEYSPTMPNIASVHNRLNVEIARGCPNSCLFCQAKNYYWPWRPRHMEAVKKAVSGGLKNTGYDEVALTSLSSADYKGIAPLVAELISGNTKYPLSVSLPSLHCRNFTKELAQNLSKSSSRPTITFAPEAGSEKLRAALGKNLSDQALYDAISNAILAGWKQIKLYFMYGLPDETQDDLEGIVVLVRNIRAKFKGLKIKLTLSPFVPKAQTTFERKGQNNIAELDAKLSYLKKNLKADLKTHNISTTVIEGLIARGDRRIAQVILRAYKAGCRFDQWHDRFDYDKWLTAAAESQLDISEILGEKSVEQKLPWSHINMFPSQESGEFRPVEGLADEPPTAAVPGINAVKKSVNNVDSTFRFRFRVSRLGMSRFISHNDQLDMFRYAARRAGLPLVYSKGYSPKPKISVGPAISVGHESMVELFECELKQYLPIVELKEVFSKQLPQGFELISVRQVPSVFPSLESLCNVAEYNISFKTIHGELDAQLKEFDNSESWTIKLERAGKIREYDIKKTILTLKKNDNAGLLLIQDITPGKNIKPEKVVDAIFGIENVYVRRERYFTRKKDGSLMEVL